MRGRTCSKGSRRPSMRRSSRRTCQPKRDLTGSEAVSSPCNRARPASTSAARSPGESCPREPPTPLEGQSERVSARSANRCGCRASSAIAAAAASRADRQAVSSSPLGANRIWDAWVRGGVRNRSGALSYTRRHSASPGRSTSISMSRTARTRASSGVSSRPSSSRSARGVRPSWCARSSSRALMARAWPAAIRASSGVAAGWFWASSATRRSGRATPSITMTALIGPGPRRGVRPASGACCGRVASRGGSDTRPAPKACGPAG